MKKLNTLLLLFVMGISSLVSAQCVLDASFTYSQSGDDIIFTNTSTGIPTGAFYDWTYNSQYSASSDPTFTSIGAADGDYACLTIYDSTWTCTDSICLPVYLDSTGCNLNISWTQSISGGNITFTNTSTGVPSPASFVWLYDGQSMSVENPTFAYNPSITEVCFAIDDLSGGMCSDSTCGPVFTDSTGTGCNIDISFTYTAFGGDIYFSNTSSGVPVGASYDWWYGSQSSADENPIFNSVYGNEIVCLTIYDSSWICYDSICTTVFVDSTADTTMTVQTEDVIEFNVYPNPANDILTISIDNESEVDRIEILDLTGRLVMVQNIENENSIIQLNVSDLPEGVYLVRIYNGDNSTKLSSRRFVKN